MGSAVFHDRGVSVSEHSLLKCRADRRGLTTATVLALKDNFEPKHPHFVWTDGPARVPELCNKKLGTKIGN